MFTTLTKVSGGNSELSDKRQSHQDVLAIGISAHLLFAYHRMIIPIVRYLIQPGSQPQ